MPSFVPYGGLKRKEFFENPAFTIQCDRDLNDHIQKKKMVSQPCDQIIYIGSVCSNQVHLSIIFKVLSMSSSIRNVSKTYSIIPIQNTPTNTHSPRRRKDV